MSPDLAALERFVADALLARDPGAEIDRLANDAALDGSTRALFARLHRDGARIAGLIVARLRFERLIHGDADAARWYDEDARAFTAAFRRYHAEVIPTAVFPSEEAASWRAWREQTVPGTVCSLDGSV